MDQDHAEWKVPKEVDSEGEIVEKTDLLACARRHRDFFQDGLHVTKQSIVQFDVKEFHAAKGADRIQGKIVRFHCKTAPRQTA